MSISDIKSGVDFSLEHAFDSNTFELKIFGIGNFENFCYKRKDCFSQQKKTKQNSNKYCDWKQPAY